MLIIGRYMKEIERHLYMYTSTEWWVNHGACFLFNSSASWVFRIYNDIIIARFKVIKE